MEVLFFILLIVFLVVNNGKKPQKGKSAGKARRPSERFAQRMAEIEKILETDAEPAKATPAVQAAKAAKVKAQAKPQAKTQAVRPVKVAGQASPVFIKAPGILEQEDDEGCVGGSMAHTQHEGESRAEHRQHLEKIQHQEQEETLAAQAALELAELNVHRLRRAVVMAEILDRPRALRARR